MDWFFDGLGTLIVGLILGAAGGATVMRIRYRSLRQRQSARDNATQVMTGRDVRGPQP